jgi:predicted nucleic acid-binding protein
MHSVYHLQVTFAILEKRPSAESRDLDGFETWLRQSRLSEPTIQEHVDNMRLFSRYLLLYADSLYTTSIGIKIPPS